MTKTNINDFKTIKEVEEYRKQINEACDKRVEFIELCVKAGSFSEKPFLYLKESFENMSPVLFESTEGKKIIAKYTNTIKGNESLKNLHALYENIRKASSSVDTDYLVNSITSFDWKVSKKGLNEGMKELSQVLAEAYLTIGKKADDLLAIDNVELSKSAEYIAEHKKTTKNITEYSEAVKIIKEAVANQKPSQVIEWKKDSVGERLIREFNEKYSDKLSDEEAELIKEVSSENAPKVFEKLKEKCISKIDEAKKDSDDNTVNRLSVIREQVSGKKFSENSFIEDVCGMFEMINVLGQE